MYPTAAYLIQTVFTVRLRINFHFHHHRIRTSNVAEHLGRVSCKIFGLPLYQEKKKSISSRALFTLPTSSPRHFLSPSSLCGGSEKPPAVGYINEMPNRAAHLQISNESRFDIVAVGFKPIRSRVTSARCSCSSSPPVPQSVRSPGRPHLARLL